MMKKTERVAIRSVRPATWVDTAFKQALELDGNVGRGELGEGLFRETTASPRPRRGRERLSTSHPDDAAVHGFQYRSVRKPSDSIDTGRPICAHNPDTRDELADAFL
jgi:hypothetical protein